MTLQLRPRRPEDVAPLTEVLAAQQPTSGYPMRWPLPFPIEEFVVRTSEDAAWVAELDDRLVGHVAVCRVEGEMLAEFTAAGLTEPLGMVAVLFVDPAVRGHGVGGRLLDRAVGCIRAAGRRPVLDVAPVHAAALAIYERRGWRLVGTRRPPWLAPGLADLRLMTLD